MRIWRTLRNLDAAAQPLQAAGNRTALRQGQEDDPAGQRRPLVGQVAAGEPVLAEENIEENLEIPDVIGGEDGDYILQVRGESMKDAGILEGDYVVVAGRLDHAADGEIVVALIGEEATVKRIFRESNPTFASNPRTRRWSRSAPPRPKSSAALSASSARSDTPVCNGPFEGYHDHAGLSGRGGRDNPSRKVRTPQSEGGGYGPPGKPAGKCHRKTQPMARPHGAESRTGKGEMVR